MPYPLVVMLLLIPISFLTTCAPPSGDKQNADIPVTTKSIAQATTPNLSQRVQQNIQIQKVDISILETYPLQINVVAQVTVPNSCLTVGDISEDRQNSTFNLTLLSAPQTNSHCVEQPQTIEQIIPLNLQGLNAGVYTVNINEASTEFELMMDMVL
ncbi:hypothetical protein BegalDRAFT_0606 [Beggiatoa alba B18LD]|uniref:Uncharacterized protein n=1 Tax=Beggiatoa alba B18LD TaxID=395493 RepID=I3CD28_9GAMM|nr:hypothetical protein [Beggiatoa alba]EIJ41521.1 hypothetical protein BegalDRAFT_0606 [Beggiatoa alba B18LD]